METVVYRQYFDLQLEQEPRISTWHHQGDSLVVYLDFHKTLKENESWWGA